MFINFIKNNKQINKGFTLIELLISIFIISILTVTVTTFQRDIFRLNTNLHNNLSAQLDLRHVTKIMVSELRKAETSSVGGYPIGVAGTSEIIFYSDLYGTGLKERVRYFLSNGKLKKGVITPSGNPLVYSVSNEKVSTLVSDIVSSSTLPIFQYYSEFYNGNSVPLSQPVPITDIRLVKVTVIIDKDPNMPPGEMIGTSQVNLRNLKNNL